ncbi:polysaccharide biosynthesis/export family protein [Flavobacterium sp. NRK F10]|nr:MULTISPECIES: polysaccharide biosynthesis/export family protein [Flavobacterium]MCO6174200.1 polysaccharide biosynthesis/export family protein [Flavobacterium sp. NRK F10]
MYNENGQADSSAVSYNPVLQPDDVLFIVVSSQNPEVVAPYNLNSVAIQGTSEESFERSRLQTYIIDKEGNIEFPSVGTIKLGGLTREEAVTLLKDTLKDYVSDATINLRILNYKVSVLGEVNKPGSFSISSERITVLEAISKAGDLTIYGRRDNVLLIREQDGVKTTQRIDLTKSDFINSPYYYLAQNDVIYVEPNKTKVNSSAIGPNLTLGISLVSILASFIVLVTR